MFKESKMMLQVGKDLKWYIWSKQVRKEEEYDDEEIIKEGGNAY